MEETTVGDEVAALRRCLVVERSRDAETGSSWRTGGTVPA